MKSSIQQHLWYLCQPLVVLALFGEDTPQDIRQDMAAALRRTQRPARFPPGKPLFPTRIIRDDECSLASFVGPKAWLMFHLFDVGAAWLDVLPALWPEDPDYVAMHSNVKGLAVVNDCAERSTKDIQDYANAARDGDYRGDIILVSASHRIKLQSFPKNEMEENV